MIGAHRGRRRLLHTTSSGSPPHQRRWWAQRPTVSSRVNLPSGALVNCQRAIVVSRRYPVRCASRRDCWLLLVRSCRLSHLLLTVPSRARRLWSVRRPTCALPRRREGQATSDGRSAACVARATRGGRRAQSMARLPVSDSRPLARGRNFSAARRLLLRPEPQRVGSHTAAGDLASPNV